MIVWVTAENARWEDRWHCRADRSVHLLECSWRKPGRSRDMVGLSLRRAWSGRVGSGHTEQRSLNSGDPELLKV